MSRFFNEPIYFGDEGYLVLTNMMREHHYEVSCGGQYPQDMSDHFYGWLSALEMVRAIGGDIQLHLGYFVMNHRYRELPLDGAECTQEIYKLRREEAELRQRRLLALQAEIISKSKAFVKGSGTYTSAERAADRDAIQEAMEQLTLAIKAILDIEEAAKE